MFVRAANPTSHRLARLAFWLACLSALVVGASGFLHRFAVLDVEWSLDVFRYGSYLAMAAIALALATIVPTRPGERRRGFLAALLGLIVGVAAVWTPISWFLRAHDLPVINDVSTDTATPPVLVATLALRRGAANPPAYPGAGAAALQKAAYPDIVPLVLPIKPDDAFRRVDKVATALGWEIVARAPAEGRLEAVATTRWFGFHDDIVIRIRAEGSGSRIDIRSKSRVGRSDLGANARRIRGFLSNLKAES
jgi:uncharacterized protein (DUF1499 family)